MHPLLLAVLVASTLVGATLYGSGWTTVLVGAFWVSVALVWVFVSGAVFMVGVVVAGTIKEYHAHRQKRG